VINHIAIKQSLGCLLDLIWGCKAGHSRPKMPNSKGLVRHLCIFTQKNRLNKLEAVL